jgi:hypothetical protein
MLEVFSKFIAAFAQQATDLLILGGTFHHAVTPAKAGVQCCVSTDERCWIPAFAGMTVEAAALKVQNSPVTKPGAELKEQSNSKLSIRVWRGLGAIS